MELPKDYLFFEIFNLKKQVTSFRYMYHEENHFTYPKRSLHFRDFLITTNMDLKKDRLSPRLKIFQEIFRKNCHKNELIRVVKAPPLKYENYHQTFPIGSRYKKYLKHERLKPIKNNNINNKKEETCTNNVTCGSNFFESLIFQCSSTSLQLESFDGIGSESNETGSSKSQTNLKEDCPPMISDQSTPFNINFDNVAPMNSITVMTFPRLNRMSSNKSNENVFAVKSPLLTSSSCSSTNEVYLPALTGSTDTIKAEHILNWKNRSFSPEEKRNSHISGNRILFKKNETDFINSGNSMPSDKRNQCRVIFPPETNMSSFNKQTYDHILPIASQEFDEKDHFSLSRIMRKELSDNDLRQVNDAQLPQFLKSNLPTLNTFCEGILTNVKQRDLHSKTENIFKNCLSESRVQTKKYYSGVGSKTEISDISSKACSPNDWVKEIKNNNAVMKEDLIENNTASKESSCSTISLQDEPIKNRTFFKGPLLKERPHQGLIFCPKEQVENKVGGKVKVFEPVSDFWESDEVFDFNRKSQRPPPLRRNGKSIIREERSHVNEYHCGVTRNRRKIPLQKKKYNSTKENVDTKLTDSLFLDDNLKDSLTNEIKTSFEEPEEGYKRVDNKIKNNFMLDYKPFELSTNEIQRPFRELEEESILKRVEGKFKKLNPFFDEGLQNPIVAKLIMQSNLIIEDSGSALDSPNPEFEMKKPMKVKNSPRNPKIECIGDLPSLKNQPAFQSLRASDFQDKIEEKVVKKNNCHTKGNDSLSFYKTDIKKSNKLKINNSHDALISNESLFTGGAFKKIITKFGSGNGLFQNRCSWNYDDEISKPVEFSTPRNNVEESEMQLFGSNQGNINEQNLSKEALSQDHTVRVGNNGSGEKCNSPESISNIEESKNSWTSTEESTTTDTESKMTSIEKDKIGLCIGSINEDILTTESGKPVILFNHAGDPITDLKGRLLKNNLGVCLLNIKNGEDIFKNNLPMFDSQRFSNSDLSFDPTIAPPIKTVVRITDSVGNAVTLFNNLGSPLTDEDGMLLHDCNGDALVSMDGKYSPVLCTNKSPIYLKNGTNWLSQRCKYTVTIISDHLKSDGKLEADKNTNRVSIINQIPEKESGSNIASTQYDEPLITTRASQDLHFRNTIMPTHIPLDPIQTQLTHENYTNRPNRSPSEPRAPMPIFDIEGNRLTDDYGYALHNRYGESLVLFDSNGFPISDHFGGPIFTSAGEQILLRDLYNKYGLQKSLQEALKKSLKPEKPYDEYEEYCEDEYPNPSQLFPSPKPEIVHNCYPNEQPIMQFIQKHNIPAWYIKSYIAQTSKVPIPIYYSQKQRKLDVPSTNKLRQQINRQVQPYIKRCQISMQQNPYNYHPRFYNQPSDHLHFTDNERRYLPKMDLSKANYDDMEEDEEDYFTENETNNESIYLYDNDQTVDRNSIDSDQFYDYEYEREPCKDSDNQGLRQTRYYVIR